MKDKNLLNQRIKYKEDFLLLDELKEELISLKEVEKELILQLENKPEGSLNIATKKGKALYYNYMKEKGRVYINQKNVDLARKLAQKKYEKKLLEHVQKRIRYMKQLIDTYEVSLYDFYDNLIGARKNIVTSFFPENEDYISQWLKSNPAMQNKYPYSAIFYTNKEEAVRSKSEKIIADMLNKYNVPYVYEPRVQLSGSSVYPDFKVLNVRLRKEYIYEHFGMMDDMSYAISNIEKINSYTKKGILLGEQLLCSFETKSSPLDTKMIESMIKHYLI